MNNDAARTLVESLRRANSTLRAQCEFFRHLADAEMNNAIAVSRENARLQAELDAARRVPA